MTTSQLPLPDRLDDDRSLMSCLGMLLSESSGRGPDLWLMVIDSDMRALPTLTTIGDIPEGLDRRMVDQLFVMVGNTIEARARGGSIAIAIERTGLPEPGPLDIGWASALRRGAHDAAVGLRGPYLVVDGRVSPIP